MARNNQYTNHNFMEDMRHIISEMENLKPEAEACNVSCPTFGCTEGPCSEKFINSVGYNSANSPQLKHESSTIASRYLSCASNSPKTFSSSSLTFSPPCKNINSSCAISVCQVPSTKLRIPPRHSGLTSNLESSPTQICYPPVQEQPLQRYQTFTSQFLHQQPCPQSSSYMVSIPFQ
ncbi:uncharacterized protein LOC130669821 isoform X2 [Microplitis mediator]|uniref:uncharacterized protein LOC130669821 isoform X2 n=1 Tax=Microplitis mediator TaxID=375433 RepID=UPI0025541865|nr:uncharacterized protein LOC130669821 isoform X2 [Microplitis mediator]